LDFSIPGAGANAAEGASAEQSMAANVAKECLLAAIKADGKSAHIWANLAYAFAITGNHRISSKCLEKVLMAPLLQSFIAYLLRLFIGFLVLVRGENVLAFDSLETNSRGSFFFWHFFPRLKIAGVTHIDFTCIAFWLVLVSLIVLPCFY
jgi:hypothetical protein